ncbi:MAG: M1 family metallopeptidase [Propionibacteriaceae bacterium]
MSGSSPPTWGPPPAADRVRHRPYRAAYVVGVLGAAVLVLALIVPPTLGWLVLRGAADLAGRPTTTTRPADADAGVGDPYFPAYGSGGYDAQSYAISIDWDAGDASLRGRTTITAVAQHDLTAIFVDLALDVSGATVDGAPATVARTGVQDVRITPPTMISSGSRFAVVIDYAGRPAAQNRDGVAPYAAESHEWVIAGEPESSAWWFPADDYPADPATFDLSVRVPAGTEAVSVGRLVSRDTGTESGFDTWHWVLDQPVATYLVFLAIGQYELQQGTAGGRPYVYAVSSRLSREARTSAFAQLQRTPVIIAEQEKRFGPYPFAEIGGVVPAVNLPFAGLEAQTRPVYDAESITDERFATELLVHELAHQWFGDHVTLSQWNDIFTNEAYASWAAWAYTEDQGGASAQERLLRTYDRTVGRADFWAVTMIDPGADHLFDTVYVRGPMALQALRNVIGDAAFAHLNREWAQHPGARSLEQWMVKAQSVTTTDLSPFFAAWIYSPQAPAKTAVNGLA